MKIFYIFIILIFFNNCSFDNKTGIWDNVNTVSKEENKIFKEFKTLSTSSESFRESIELKKNFNFFIPKKIKNQEWNDIFYSGSNNYKNFSYNGLNEIFYRSKKITKYSIRHNILLENDNIIIVDYKGNIIIYSLEKKKIFSKFNFYKNQFKNIKKKLNYIIEDEIIYISDNIGYLYAYNYKKKNVIWAKNFKIPFRSNLKIYKNKIILANQNNNLLFINKNSGEILKQLPTEETLVKNDFENNLSLNTNSVFFLNTYGSLYSIDNERMRINWFLNLNRSIDINPTNLFSGKQVISDGKIIVISTEDDTYIINANSGSIIFKKKFSAKLKPLIIENYLFVVTKNNFLVCMDLKTGSLIYSYNINQKIANFTKTKKKEIILKDIIMANDKILLFLENSYVLKLNVNGNLEQINKLPSKMKTFPIFVNNFIYFLDKKNKLTIIN